MISVANDICADAVDGGRGGLDRWHGSQHARAQAGLRRHAAHDVTNTINVRGSRLGIERLSNHRADRCNASSPAQTRAMAYGMSGQPATRSADLIQDLANFLLIRGPYSWLGWGWKGCSQHYYFPPEFNEVRTDFPFCDAGSGILISLLSLLSCAQDYGEPSGLCKETSAGSEVFTRDFSKATVQMDCKAWQGTITMK